MSKSKELLTKVLITCRANSSTPVEVWYELKKDIQDYLGEELTVSVKQGYYDEYYKDYCDRKIRNMEQSARYKLDKIKRVLND